MAKSKQYKDRYSDLSLDQVDTLISELREHRKDVQKKEERAYMKDIMRSLRIGHRVYTRLKGGSMAEGTVTALTENSVTVRLDDNTRVNRRYNRLKIKE